MEPKRTGCALLLAFFGLFHGVYGANPPNVVVFFVDDVSNAFTAGASALNQCVHPAALLDCAWCKQAINLFIGTSFS